MQFAKGPGMQNIPYRNLPLKARRRGRERVVYIYIYIFVCVCLKSIYPRRVLNN